MTARDASVVISSLIAMASDELLELSAKGDASSQELETFLEMCQDRGAVNFLGPLRN